MVRAHVVVEGRVQGVAFRYFTAGEAERLGIEGWVRNQRNGTVEAVFEGDDAAVKKMVEWCRAGPPSAIVGSVDVKWEDYRGEFTGFIIQY